MTKIDIVSGFLGAGKTTLINRLIHEAYEGEKVVLIENEFGEIGIDSGFLQDSGVKIAEMNSGCICCSLVGDFSKALKQVVSDFHPDRILIEPSGVGKLSDVTKAVLSAELEDAVLNSAVVVVDVNKCKMYMKNFGEFFNDQIVHAGCIVFSHTDKTTDQKLAEALSLVRKENDHAEVVTTPATQLDIHTLIHAMENKKSMAEELKELIEEESCPVCGHHHHDYHHDNFDCDHEHEHHHEHHHDEHKHEHDHDHDHDHCHEHHEHCDHEHHHEHHDHCDCDHHDHDHEHEHGHHHHHADDVFTSWGMETLRRYDAEEMKDILLALENSDVYGMVLRAKGIVQATDGSWIHFDYVPEEPDVRIGSPASIGKICVIGAHIDEEALTNLFHSDLKE